MERRFETPSGDTALEPMNAPGASEDTTRFTLLELAAVLLRQRRLLITVPLLAASVALVYTLMQPRTYSAVATFMPHTTDRRNVAISGLAAQLGVDIGGTQPTQSPAFYAELARSHEILHDLVLAVQPALIRDRQALEDAIAGMRDRIQITTSPQTGTVRIRVQTQSAALSEIIAVRLLDEINRFNLERRQSQAAAERRFIEARVSEARRDLNLAESRLRDFLAANRVVGNSPHLALQRDRLSREVSLKQALFTTLTEAYEQARIEEVRNLAVITVIERPFRPVRPDSRGLAGRLAVALFVGLVTAMFFALTREAMHRSRTMRPASFAEVREQWQSTLSDLRHPVRVWRALQRRRTAPHVTASSRNH